MGSGCGSVGRLVTSDTRSPRFESSHQLNSIQNMFLRLGNCSKVENKEKEVGNGPLEKTTFIAQIEAKNMPTK